ncbi:ATP-dependent dethiobiotin synthetase BioD [Gordonia hirsuta DSM 44140 = NBRC 16056]|uniref:ATP-dependent dethiobiotin synthetase BioD n=1 Tax=Gordonia hirsuta DSM 44140 = NBRC 16056 TaxID=1121927 RepID=L7L442_9ACTN|nr:dethiobiotin synthase [Gordonia hirsuta]GAC55915.1 ATP-dependent dethiobiotin synthetase BioD [Gordonia hirsuta DSM 44140 = NBRC 16056]
MSDGVLVVTGTSTGVGKTVAVAALAAAAASAGARVAVVKPAQTGVGPREPGDLAAIAALVGDLPAAEIVRYREPLAPETAARREGSSFLRLEQVRRTVDQMRAQADLVLIEGAGGVLVRLAPELTVLELAGALGAQVAVVTDPGLGTLNHTELTVAALRAAGRDVAGLIIGSWPEDPDLAMRCNAEDLPRLTGLPVLATLPAGAGALRPEDFQAAAPTWFAHPVGSLIAGRSVPTEGEIP